MTFLVFTRLSHIWDFVSTVILTVFHASPLHIVSSSIVVSLLLPYSLYVYVLAKFWQFVIVFTCSWGTRQRSWLRHYAASRKVAG
jgi:hypothetical protein